MAAALREPVQADYDRIIAQIDAAGQAEQDQGRTPQIDRIIHAAVTAFRQNGVNITERGLTLEVLRRAQVERPQPMQEAKEEKKINE